MGALKAASGKVLRVDLDRADERLVRNGTVNLLEDLEDDARAALERVAGVLVRATVVQRAEKLAVQRVSCCQRAKLSAQGRANSSASANSKSASHAPQEIAVSGVQLASVGARVVKDLCGLGPAWRVRSATDRETHGS